MSDGVVSPAEHEKLREEREKLAATVTAQRELISSLQGKNAALENALINHADEIELLKRRLFGARSERGGTHELQLLLGEILTEEVALQKQLDELRGDPKGDDTNKESSEKPKQKPKGRRDLSLSSLPKVIVDLTDPVLAEKGELIGFDESRQLGRRRGGFYVVVKRTAKYRIPGADGPTVLSVDVPKSALSRGMLHTSLLAWLAVEKFALGVPHHRLEQHLVAEGVPLDRSVMSRNMEELGNLLGATIAHTMLEHARTSCAVLSTDATGAAIQPGPRESGPKRPCKKGHFFTIVADRDHVLFEYANEHSSNVVSRLFQGFTGFLQSDASSVYDILERGPPALDERGPTLVGCWAHCRRYFFEAAVCKYRVGLEGLQRIRAIYSADNQLAKLPPSDRTTRRRELVAPLIEDFFCWVKEQSRSSAARNLASKALGYATNQEHELRRVLDDGRLPLDNTRSERALRKIVVGRKNWLFYGSDLHAQAAVAIFSVIASCRLHGLDPVAYIDEVLRLLAVWPRERYLEITPLQWAATRARLSAAELEDPIRPITVPPPLAPTSDPPTG